MIKVEIFYRVSLLGTEKTMSEAEYEEFRTEVGNLPIYYKYPFIALSENITYVKGVNDATHEPEEAKNEITIRDCFGEEVGKIYDECSDFIEPPEEPSKHVHHINITPPFVHTLCIPPEPFAHTSPCPPRATPEEIEKYSPIREEPEPAVPVSKNKTLYTITTVPKKVKKPAPIPDEYEEKFKAPYSLNVNKKPGRQGRDYDAYVEMMIEGATKSEVINGMMLEFGITKLNAEQVYTRLLKRVASETAKVKISTMKPENQSPVTIVEPAKVRPPKALRDEIAGMPNYKDAIALKDVFIRRSDCNAFDFITLKEYYKVSHPGVQW